METSIMSDILDIKKKSEKIIKGVEDNMIIYQIGDMYAPKYGYITNGFSSLEDVLKMNLSDKFIKGTTYYIWETKIENEINIALIKYRWNKHLKLWDIWGE